MIAAIDVTGVRIETERLILRPWEMRDLEYLYEYASVPGVGEMAGWCHHKTREESQRVLEMFRSEKKTFALELKENGKVIGSLGLEALNPDPGGEWKAGREIGYVLGKEYWVMGLMPEAVRSVIFYCFEKLHYDFLTCRHFLHNTQSQRVIEKCGFAYFGETQYTTRYDTVETSKIYILYNK